MRIVVQRDNWVIFLRKWARSSRYSQRIFVDKNCRGNIWFQQDEATLDVLHPIFKDGIISRIADIIWPPRSCDLTPLDYYFWGAVKDKCYADKPETIDALKDNIREAIGEIQLHTIDSVLKN